MMREEITLLTIIEDDSRASMYELLMREAGVEVVHAEGALHALTQLERLSIDAVVCEALMEDMTGEEFEAVLAEDDRTRAVPVFILPDAAALSADSRDLAKPVPCGPLLLMRVLGHLEADAATFPEVVNPAAKAQLQGDLSVFQLPELLNWVSEMRLHGHWVVKVQDAQEHTRSAHLYMKDGNLAYAEFAGLLGRKAMFALMRAITMHSRASFRFLRMERALPLAPSDLKQSTARLLIELAVDLDHMQAGHLH